MHRLSIRSQIMVLSGSFILTLSGFAVVAWMISDTLGTNIHATHDNVGQLQLLSDLYEDVAEAQLDVLQFAAGEGGQIEELRDNLADIAASIEAAERVFSDTEVPDQAFPEIIETLKQVGADIAAASGDAD